MCGYKVGLYTSPHLVDFSERIRINGNPISEEYVIDFIQNEKAFFEPLKPTFFELVTAMAFKYFADKAVDIAVIETGMGGRLDCTNIISPTLSIITNIGLDHTQFLGSTLEQIAMEKAGIIKPKTPVVIGETTPETRQIFEVMAAEIKAPITFAEDQREVIDCMPFSDGLLYHTVHDGILEGELSGSYQENNTNTILCAIRKLEEIGLMYPLNTIPEEPCRNREIRLGFKQVCDLTGLKGRWQKVKDHPLTICDTGHNVPGWTYLGEQLKNVPCKHRHIVFGMVEDKDIFGVMALLPKDATYYFTKANNKRAASEGVLKMYGLELGLHGDSYPDVASAYNAAQKAAEEKDFVFIGGSSYVVAEFLKNCI
jgi:dihydrofolate synthase/folylpolyglutamate synthase